MAEWTIHKPLLFHCSGWQRCLLGGILIYLLSILLCSKEHNRRALALSLLWLQTSSSAGMRLSTEEQGEREHLCCEVLAECEPSRGQVRLQVLGGQQLDPETHNTSCAINFIRDSLSCGTAEQGWRKGVACRAAGFSSP